MSIDYNLFAFPKGQNGTKNRKKEKVSKDTYEKVLKACKGKCAICGTKDILELHHILGRGKDLTDNPDNCIMLCRNCHHNIVHQNNKKYRPLLLKIRGEMNE